MAASATPANLAPVDVGTANGCPAIEIAVSELRRGARGRVARVLGDTTESARLKALGVCEGRLVEVLRTGDALVLRVLGSRIGISRQLAASVFLTAA